MQFPLKFVLLFYKLKCPGLNWTPLVVTFGGNKFSYGKNLKYSHTSYVGKGIENWIVKELNIIYIYIYNQKWELPTNK